MKKWLLFTISTLLALTIAFYNKKSPLALADKKKHWQTFEKESDKIITSHVTTGHELAIARIPSQTHRKIASSENEENQDIQNRPLSRRNFLYRENRVLTGDIQKNDYSDEDVELEMINIPNENWKEILGHELVRFHEEKTKVLIKEEFPVIKINNGKGLYCEQVIITYLYDDKLKSSYRALVNSETGVILETWDRTIHEKKPADKSGFSLPTENKSGISVR